jgi:hypothetical protein
VRAEAGIEDVGGTFMGADVGIDEVCETVGCDVVGTTVDAEVGIGAAGETTWWEKPWARKSGTVRPVKQ